MTFPIAPRADAPLALYVHWPFCVSKCPYCDFNSHVRDHIDVEAWQRALISDLAYEAAQTGARPLRSIFFGGGTPSLMPPALVTKLIETAAQLWGFEDQIEISLEANPSSVETRAFAALAAAGVNRLSIGVQSFDDETLHFLGRAHHADEARRAICVAQQTVDRVSFDLIYARPSQQAAAWEAELSAALQFGTGHLSLYQLTIEPGTRFAAELAKGTLTELDKDEAADLYLATNAQMSAAGLPAYEISNHARAGEESRHNLIYWRGQDYVGVGPGAHGRRGGVATVRHKKPENYLSAVARHGHGIKQSEILSPSRRASEQMLMGLRLSEGIDLARIERSTGLPRTAFFDARRAGELARHGLVRQAGDHLRVMPEGRLVLDALLAELVANAAVFSDA